MPLIETLLGLAALWALAGHVVAIKEGRELKQQCIRPSSQVRTIALTLIAFILALGFLGLLLK